MYEYCDDGNGNNADNCTSLCTWTFCGDGTRQQPNGKGLLNVPPGFVEACDDGNGNNADNCTTVCGLTKCGDGILQSAGNGYGVVEVCDDGNSNNADTCTSSCRLTYCGDGIVQSAGNGYGNLEQCDNGVLNGVSGLCTSSCALITENCPSGGAQPNSLTGCRVSQPANSSNVTGYTCAFEKACYKCKAGYRWLGIGLGEKCDPVSAACGYPPTNPWSGAYTNHCGGIYAFTKGCVNMLTNTACCSGTIQDPDWDYDTLGTITPY